MAVVVLQHIRCEPPGVFEDVLVERGHEIVRLELDEGDRVPETLGGIDAVVVMGGPMGAYDTDTHPWLTDELAFIERAADADVPLLGVCLGAQLLAHAAGGRAYAGSGPEVGVLPVQLARQSAEDPLFAGLPKTIAALQWHGDTFDLPHGAVHLASSGAYPAQAFRYRRSWGLQFHVEVTAAMAEEWASVPAYRTALESVRGPGAVDGLMAEFAAANDEMVATARHIGSRFADQIG